MQSMIPIAARESNEIAQADNGDIWGGNDIMVYVYAVTGNCCHKGFGYGVPQALSSEFIRY